MSVGGTQAVMMVSSVAMGMMMRFSQVMDGVRLMGMILGVIVVMTRAMGVIVGVIMVILRTMKVVVGMIVALS